MLDKIEASPQYTYIAVDSLGNWTFNHVDDDWCFEHIYYEIDCVSEPSEMFYYYTVSTPAPNEVIATVQKFSTAIEQTKYAQNNSIDQTSRSPDYLHDHSKCITTKQVKRASTDETS